MTVDTAAIKHGSVFEYGPHTVHYVDTKEKSFSSVRSTFDLCPTNLKIKPTEFRSAFYYGYLYEKTSSNKMGLHRIIPRLPAAKSMFYSIKSHLGGVDESRLAGSRGIYARVFPFDEVITRGTRESYIPSWVPSKAAFVKGLAAITSGTSLQRVSYVFNKAKMFLLFYNRELHPHTAATSIFNNVFTLGLGAIVDAVPYLNMGNSHTRAYRHQISEDTTIVLDTTSGGNCTGSIDFLYKPDISAATAPADQVYGWNSDLSKLLNTSSIAINPRAIDVIKNLTLQLPEFVGYGISSRIFYNFQDCIDGSYTIPYRLVPIHALDFIADRKSPPSIKHPAKEDLSLYSLDMYLCSRENDMTFMNLISLYMCKSISSADGAGLSPGQEVLSRYNAECLTYKHILNRYAQEISPEELFDEEKNGGIFDLIGTCVSEKKVKDTVFVGLPISIYHTLFHKILGKINFPEKFLQNIAGDTIEDQEVKKIAYAELCFQVFAYFHQVIWEYKRSNLEGVEKLKWLAGCNQLSDAQSSKYVDEVVYGLYDSNPDLKRLGNFIRDVRVHITEPLVDDSIRETYDMALSLAA